MAETERESIRESTLEGLDTAARKGKHGGRPPVITADMFQTVLRRRAGGESVEQIQPRPDHPHRQAQGTEPLRRQHLPGARRTRRARVPTRDHTIAEQPKNYRYSTNHQVVTDADTRLVVIVGRPVPGNRNDCKAWEPSGTKDAIGRPTVTADGGYRGTGLIIPHRRDPGRAELPSWKRDNA
jgi:hypothetical protein